MAVVLGQIMAATAGLRASCLEMQAGAALGKPGKAGDTGEPVDALREMRAAEGPQAELQQGSMDRLRIRRVAIARGVGSPDREAIVDIAEPDRSLVDLLGLRIVAESAGQAPVLG